MSINNYPLGQNCNIGDLRFDEIYFTRWKVSQALLPTNKG